MLAETLPNKDRQRWQQALMDLVTDPKELLALLELDPSLLEAAERAVRLFPLKVPRGYIARMQKGNPDDPLLRQVLPLQEELLIVPGYERDPLQELEKNPIPGLLHKYHDRVLVTLTGVCAVHCRYCFRRYFPYEENNPGRHGWEKIFNYIQNNTNITEVILSGGDPLAVSDQLLTSFTQQLKAIKHIKRLRIHTRLPIVLPERITEGFVQWIQQLSLPLSIVVHANHPQEINHEVHTAIATLRRAGVHVFNQSVLLKDINDDADTLIKLSEALYTAGIIPYYLHVNDKVQGAAHFDLPLERALALHTEMTKRLPGYLVPRLVREDPGMPAKTLLK